MITGLTNWRRRLRSWGTSCHEVILTRLTRPLSFGVAAHLIVIFQRGTWDLFLFGTCGIILTGVPLRLAASEALVYGVKGLKWVICLCGAGIPLFMKPALVAEIESTCDTSVVVSILTEYIIPLLPVRVTIPESSWRWARVRSSENGFE